MSKLVVTISDDLAALVLERQQRHGYPTPDEAVAALISEGLVADHAGEDHTAGHSNDDLRTLIDEADASGPAETWDPRAARAEILRRYAELTRDRT